LRARQRLAVARWGARPCALLQNARPAAQYLARQVTKVGVRVELNTAVTPELIEERKPDGVILASGSEPSVPSIPGVDKPKMVRSSDIFQRKVAPMRANVLVIGGDSVGCEVADALAGFGDNPLDVDNRVTIVELSPSVAGDEVAGARMLLSQRLRDKGVPILTGTTVKEITNDGAVIEHNGQEQTLSGMDHIVLACGARVVENLSDKIRDTVPRSTSSATPSSRAERWRQSAKERGWDARSDGFRPPACPSGPPGAASDTCAYLNDSA